MYTLVKTFAQLNGAGSFWEEVDAGSVPLADLFKTYQKINLQLHESFSGQDQVFDLYSIQAEVQYLTTPLSDWLTGIGNRNLRAEKGTYSLKTSKVYSYDAITLDFLPQVGNTAYHPSNDIPLDEQTDILLTKPKVNYTNLGKNCLFTVGGFFHPHEYGSTGVFVVGGNKTTLRSGSQEIGIVDFSRLGEVEIQPIGGDNLMSSTTMLPYRESVYLKLPRAVKEGETLALVFGGYLHILDGSYTILSETAAKINMQAMSLHQRFFRSRMYLDLSSLEATLDTSDPLTDLQPQVLLSDKAIAAWLNHPCSFWVYIKADSLQVMNEALPRPHIPGRYYLGRNPEGLLRMDFGEMPAYIQTYEPPIWLLSSMWEQRRNVLFETTAYKDSRVKVLNDTPYLHHTDTESFPSLLQIHRVALITT